MKRKKYHEVDPQEAMNALRSLKNEPNFKKYIDCLLYTSPSPRDS